MIHLLTIGQNAGQPLCGANLTQKDIDKHTAYYSGDVAIRSLSGMS